MEFVVAGLLVMPNTLGGMVFCLEECQVRITEAVLGDMFTPATPDGAHKPSIAILGSSGWPRALQSRERVSRRSYAGR